MYAYLTTYPDMGKLTTLLADEITQPVATALNNARAALHFLDRSPPDLSEVREALECIVADADRAGDIIKRVRDQIKKAPPRKAVAADWTIVKAIAKMSKKKT